MGGKWQRHGLEIAKRLVGESDDGCVDVFAWRSASTEAGMGSQTQIRVLEALAEYGEIVRQGNRLTVPGVV